MSGKTLVIPAVITGARLAKPFNDNFNAIADVLNGNVGDGNLANDAVGSEHLKQGAANSRALATGSVIPSKIPSVSFGATQKTASTADAAVSTSLKDMPKGATGEPYVTLTVIPTEDCKIVLDGVCRMRQDLPTSPTDAEKAAVVNLNIAIAELVDAVDTTVGIGTAAVERSKLVTVPVKAIRELIAGKTYKYSLKYSSSSTATKVDISGDSACLYTGLSYQLVPKVAVDA